MTSSGPYAVTDRLGDSVLQVIVARLEARGRHDQERLTNETRPVWPR